MREIESPVILTPLLQVLHILDALEVFIRQRPKIKSDAYLTAGGNSQNWIDAKRGYRADMQMISKERKRALVALLEARNVPPRLDVLLQSFAAFSGRLQWTDSGLEYTPGQEKAYEYRSAAATVLEQYVRSSRRIAASENPQAFVYHTVKDVIQANKSIGEDFFSPATMKVFQTRIASPLYDGKYLIISDKTPRGRAYSILQAEPNGQVNYVGKPGSYRTKRAALAEILGGSQVVETEVQREKNKGALAIDKQLRKERSTARNAVNNAIRLGKLERQPCIRCGNPKGEAHHTDYAKPLEVVWLCHACHKTEHRKL